MLTTDSMSRSRSAASFRTASFLGVLSFLFVPGCIVDGHQPTGTTFFTKPQQSSGLAAMKPDRHVCPTCSAPLAPFDPGGGSSIVPADTAVNGSASVGGPGMQAATAVPVIPMIPQDPVSMQQSAGFSAPAASMTASAGMMNQLPSPAVPIRPESPLPYQKAMAQNGAQQQATWDQNQAARAQSAAQSQAAHTNSMLQQPQMQQQMAVASQMNQGSTSSPQTSNAGGFNEPWCNINNQTNTQSCPPVPQTAAVDNCEDRVAMLEQKLESLNSQLSRTQGTLEMTVGELEQTKQATLSTENRAMHLELQNKHLMEQFHRMQREQDQQLDLIEEAVTGDPAVSPQPMPQASVSHPNRRASPAKAQTVSRTRSPAVTLPAVEE